MKATISTIESESEPMSDTSQPNPVEDNADAEVQPIPGKPSQAEGDEGDSNASSGNGADSDGS